MHLNANVLPLVQGGQGAWFDRLRVREVAPPAAGGTTILDFGVEALGGLEAGLVLARVCLADLGSVELRASGEWPWPVVEVRTDHPVLACLASQYAGWEIKGEGYFAMASGPMRAVAAREPLFAEIGYREAVAPGLNDRCVGVLEASRFPPAAVCDEIARKCGVSPDRLTLLAAPTRSIAGTVQIVARSVETALHKLHALKFDLDRVVSATGSAPLPPPAASDLGAIGRTNDAILYGGRVVLYVRGEDASLEAIGPQTPSSASRDYGQPFAATLAAYGNDFYKVDPLLFSPAEVTFANLDTGRSWTYGGLNREILRQSFVS
ncbi:MAG TPA: methenyltetrahydromethanopterin cyclohydrolase [Lacipirellulaceae bacterium]|nr:methenyltetrahydromethanopterin cyclohydrolase [Lacipirellulaceae bacterium]